MSRSEGRAVASRPAPTHRSSLCYIKTLNQRKKKEKKVDKSKRPPVDILMDYLNHIFRFKCIYYTPFGGFFSAQTKCIISTLFTADWQNRHEQTADLEASHSLIPPPLDSDWNQSSLRFDPSAPWRPFEKTGDKMGWGRLEEETQLLPHLHPSREWSGDLLEQRVSGRGAGLGLWSSDMMDPSLRVNASSKYIGAALPAATILSFPVAAFVDVDLLAWDVVLTALKPTGLVVVMCQTWKKTAS